MKDQTSINADELVEIIVHTVNNNKFLQEKGDIPLAIGIEGIAGLGKTSIVEQTAAKLGLEFTQLNLAEIDEVSELIGFPLKQYQLCKKGTPRESKMQITLQEVPKKVMVSVPKQVKGADGELVTRNVMVEQTVMEQVEVKSLSKLEDSTECLWIDEAAVNEYLKREYEFTGKSRMSYSPPEWIAGKGENGIFFIDDFSRGEQRFMQSTMRLIDRQSYISWNLPKGWTIILSSNPSNGDYQVAELDIAQSSRYTGFNLKFDIECWMRYAENKGVDGRCMNFLYLHHAELVTERCNPRAITNFFKSISSFKEFDKNLPMIQKLGEGSVGVEFSTMFVLFINNKLDRMISPKDILLGTQEKEVLDQFKSCIGVDKSYRADIASVLTTRLINFTLNYAETNTITPKILERLEVIATGDILTDDLKYILIKKLIGGNKQRFQKLLTNSEVLKMSLK